MSETNAQQDDFQYVESVVAPQMFWGMTEDTYCTMLHLAQFAHIIFPGGGYVLPIIMWATNKEQSKMIDEHGKHVLNWLISELIYMVVLILVGVVLFFILFAAVMAISEGEAAPLMFPLMLLPNIPYFCLAVLGLVFPIVGAVKANQGVCWSYPLTIRFIK
jgi:Uncharacterized protein conserved in bacteria